MEAEDWLESDEANELRRMLQTAYDECIRLRKRAIDMDASDEMLGRLTETADILRNARAQLLYLERDSGVAVIVSPAELENMVRCLKGYRKEFDRIETMRQTAFEQQVKVLQRELQTSLKMMVPAGLLSKQEVKRELESARKAVEQRLGKIMVMPASFRTAQMKQDYIELTLGYLCHLQQIIAGLGKPFIVLRDDDMRKIAESAKTYGETFAAGERQKVATQKKNEAKNLKQQQRDREEEDEDSDE